MRLMDVQTSHAQHNTAQSSDPQSTSASSSARPVAQSLTQPMLMERARNQATFDSSLLTEIIVGGKEAVARQNDAFARIEKALGTDDPWKLPPRYGNMDREEMLLEGLRAARVTVNDGMDHGHKVFYQCNHEWALSNANPFGLTGLLFIPMLKLQCNPEQLAHWLPLAESGMIIGSYAQTELGHGSFVAGLQTTATLDKGSDEFVIHTPSIPAVKYWPGALGYASTHTIVIARMIIDGKDYGIHSFIMQIRSLEDFKPLPGIELGDMGLKMAYNGTDNGYAIFNHVRIPRTHLLSRYNTVSENGTYHADPLREKLLYGGMLGARSTIIRNSAFQLAQALTIATRYSAVRVQGQRSIPNEPAIMSYKLQHYRLLTLISKAYAILFASMSANATYQKLLEAQARGDHGSLPYVHMIMAGLKAWCTQTAADGAEDARKLCGGQGYLTMSGLPEIVASVAGCCTFEGENTVMWKQVSRYLMKGMAAPALPLDMAYVCSYMDTPLSTYDGDAFLNPAVLVQVFEHRAARLVTEAYELLCSEQGSAVTAENTHAVALQVAARAHIELYILRAFIAAVSAAPSALQPVLTNLLIISHLHTASSPLTPTSSSFTSFLTPSQLSAMRSLTNVLLARLLPDAVALTDAWNFSDASMGSVLGCRDGDVYKRIMVWTRQLPINVHARENGGVLREGWEEYIGPFLGEGGVRAKL
ncbi:Peroxisomal acyl-coenzyme A oxidase 1 [Lachnellula arida]|uniref:Acyl-coenzyme A oxidase n=1 Tax=Lachnellula arida TaxID=1316785 RepID=A0A8T9BEJ2_9HELO|nr:Peroxisomal acyl-coenzyme A oxidase 1 [Lachnellula arida]